MEDVLAEDGEEAGGLVHAFEADGAGREFDEGWGRWGEGFGISGGCRRLDLEEGGWIGGGCEWVVGHVWEGRGRGGGRWGQKSDRFDEHDVAVLWLW